VSIWVMTFLGQWLKRFSSWLRGDCPPSKALNARQDGSSGITGRISPCRGRMTQYGTGTDSCRSRNRGCWRSARRSFRVNLQGAGTRRPRSSGNPSPENIPPSGYGLLRSDDPDQRCRVWVVEKFYGHLRRSHLSFIARNTGVGSDFK